MVSLKRTLQFDLACLINGIYHTVQGGNQLNLHTPVRYSEVLLSIGKITKICHQDIPVKKVSCNEIVTYSSAIPLKLANVWQRSAEDVASVVLSFTGNSMCQVCWATVGKTEQGCLEFVIAQSGIQRWQQQLAQKGLTPLMQSSPSIASQTLWQLQSGYELCCRWLASHALDGSLGNGVLGTGPQPFRIPVASLNDVVDALLNICDVWDVATSVQLLHHARRLVLALEQCISQARPTSLDASIVCPWVKTAQGVLQQLLSYSWGLPLVDKF